MTEQEARAFVRESVKRARGQRVSRVPWPSALGVEPGALVAFCCLLLARDHPALPAARAGHVAARLACAGRPRMTGDARCDALLETIAAAVAASIS